MAQSSANSDGSAAAHASSQSEGSASSQSSSIHFEGSAAVQSNAHSDGSASVQASAHSEGSAAVQTNNDNSDAELSSPDESQSTTRPNNHHGDQSDPHSSQDAVIQSKAQKQNLLESSMSKNEKNSENLLETKYTSNTQSEGTEAGKSSSLPTKSNESHKSELKKVDSSIQSSPSANLIEKINSKSSDAPSDYAKISKVSLYANNQL